MRHLILMAFAGLALAGCNGGEDFSDATVPGCPLGANCDINPRGDSLIELQGPRVANLGYRCGNSNGFTRAEEDTIGNVVVPAFHALCPANSRSVEFYIGSGLFEGNRVSLGEYVFPQRLRKGLYQLTLADLIDSPRRVSVQDGQEGTASPVLNRSALLHALNSSGNDADEAIIIPGDPEVKADTGDPNTIIDAQPELMADNGFNYDDYADFKEAWQDFIDNVNASPESNVDGFDPGGTAAYQENVDFANDRTRSGLYAFEVAGECVIEGLELEGCDFGGETGTRITFTLNSLVLPDGQLLGGGLGVRASSQENRTFDYLGFRSDASLSDLLELQEEDVPGNSFVRLLGRGIGDADAADTEADLSGRFLASTLYAGVNVDDRNDFSLDFPGADPLTESEKGKATGTLLAQTLLDDRPLSFRATKSAVVQAKPDLSGIDQGPYTIRLMRACVGESDDEDDGVCFDIPTPDDDTPEVNEEVTPPVCDDRGQNCTVAGNYQANADGGPERERVRMDKSPMPVGEFCLSIKDDGLIEIGTWNDTDQCMLTGYDVGFVTRTFADPLSANVSLMLAPGLEPAVRDQIPHYNATIEGRIDLAADGCSPMYRLGDENFEIGLRAKWVEQTYLPFILLEQEFEDPPTEEESNVFRSFTEGAVQFFKGAPGNEGCDPMVPAP